jgi:hypothetical protein
MTINKGLPETVALYFFAPQNKLARAYGNKAQLLYTVIL